MPRPPVAEPPKRIGAIPEVNQAGCRDLVFNGGFEAGAVGWKVVIDPTNEGATYPRLEDHIVLGEDRGFSTFLGDWLAVLTVAAGKEIVLYQEEPLPRVDTGEVETSALYFALDFPPNHVFVPFTPVLVEEEPDGLAVTPITESPHSEGVSGDWGLWRVDLSEDFWDLVASRDVHLGLQGTNTQPTELMEWHLDSVSFQICGNGAAPVAPPVPTMPGPFRCPSGLGGSWSGSGSVDLYVGRTSVSVDVNAHNKCGTFNKSFSTSLGNPCQFTFGSRAEGCSGGGRFSSSTRAIVYVNYYSWECHHRESFSVLKDSTPPPMRPMPPTATRCPTRQATPTPPPTSTRPTPTRTEVPPTPTATPNIATSVAATLTASAPTATKPPATPTPNVATAVAATLTAGAPTDTLVPSATPLRTATPTPTPGMETAIAATLTAVAASPTATDEESRHPDIYLPLLLKRHVNGTDEVPAD